MRASIEDSMDSIGCNSIGDRDLVTIGLLASSREVPKLLEACQKTEVIDIGTFSLQKANVRSITGLQAVASVHLAKDTVSRKGGTTPEVP
jgi:hypothetical protein